MSKKSDSEKGEDRFARAQRIREKALLHLVDLLQPHPLTDSLMPDICEELAFVAEENQMPHVALRFAQLGRESASHHFGPTHARTRMFGRLIRDYTNLTANG